MIEHNRDIQQPHILIIDDDNSINKVLTEIFSNDFSVTATTSVKEGLDTAKKLSPFLAMVDLKMPEANGIEVLKELKKIEPEMTVMIMSAYGEVGTVTEAFKEGASDFLAKPFDFRVLLKNIKQLAAIKVPRNQGAMHPQKKDIIGESQVMKDVWGLAQRFAPSDIPVLLQGETGTGKELFSNIIHSMSPRSSRPFVPVDCSSLPESLIESELFGYERGAFTGAATRKEGLFESANGGTIFLDEIGNLPLPTQGKLLRVLQDHKISRLGARGYEPVTLNIRLIAATNADLEEASQRGTFRRDLYYRISAATIVLPPLRERVGDIPILVSHFLAKFNREFNKSTGITEEAMDILNGYNWPGNIRELENVINSAFLMTNDCIRPSHFTRIMLEKKRITADISDIVNDNTNDMKTLRNKAAEETERETILQIMREHPFINKLQLAKILNVDPKTLRSKLKKYGFDSLH